jgi:hypothetical protein
MFLGLFQVQVAGAARHQKLISPGRSAAICSARARFRAPRERESRSLMGAAALAPQQVQPLTSDSRRRPRPLPPVWKDHIRGPRRSGCILGSIYSSSVALQYFLPVALSIIRIDCPSSRAATLSNVSGHSRGFNIGDLIEQGRQTHLHLAFAHHFQAQRGKAKGASPGFSWP